MNDIAKILIEVFGYAGSAAVILSFFMPSIVKLRVVNTIGSVICAAYGVIIHAYPTVVMNGCLIAINVFYLVKLMLKTTEFNLVRCSYSDASLQYFLKDNLEDIKRYFPDFNAEESNPDYILLAYNKDSIAGVFAAKETQEKALYVILDYTTPSYRDCSVGTAIHQAFAAEGISKVVIHDEGAGLIQYLSKTGFKETSEHTYVKTYS